MKLYRVTVPGRSWTMTAPNIQAASQFVKHCPSVRLRTICPMVLDIEVATGAGLDVICNIPTATVEEIRAILATDFADVEARMSAIEWTPSYVALVDRGPDPECRISPERYRK